MENRQILHEKKHPEQEWRITRCTGTLALWGVFIFSIIFERHRHEGFQSKRQLPQGCHQGHCFDLHQLPRLQ